MNRNRLVLVATIAAGAAFAMPTKKELVEVRPLVAELMAPTMVGYRNKAKSAVDVAEAALKFAEAAESEAARYLFLRGAIGFYVKSGEFGKAADTVEALKAKVANVPPSEIADIISGAFARDDIQKSPRLASLLALAQAQTKASKDIHRLSAQLKKVSTDHMRRQYAESLAITGDWRASLAEFAKVSGAVGKMTKADADGSVAADVLGDFWWTYETVYQGAEYVFRERAANYYRKAIAKGNLDGLKRTLVERRLATLVLPDVNDNSTVGRDAPTAQSGIGKGRSPSASPAVQTTSVAGTPRTTAKNPFGLVHRWSFTDGFVDSIGSITPTKYGNAKVEDGVAKLQSGSPMEFPAGTVPLAPFTIQVWASATDKGFGAGAAYILKITSDAGDKDVGVRWIWRGKTKWVSWIGAFDEGKSVGHGKMLIDGRKHLYTVVGEKAGGGMLLRFYQDDTLFGELRTAKTWKQPPMLILGGFITPTYDEVRIYSRALSHADIIASANEGPDKLPETGKGK